MPTGIYKRTKEHNQNISKSKTGIKNTMDHNQNISKARKGTKCPWNIERNKNFIFTDEIRQKMSNAHKDKKFSSETKRKMSEAHIGKVFSDEHRQKISNSLKILYKNGKLKVPFIQNNSGYRKDLGHKVRSNWEANVARILIYEGIQYEYEPKRFNLGEIGTYKPDFFIPSKNLWIEVKGRMTEISQKKINLFSENNWLMVIDQSMYKELTKYYKNKINNWE